MTTTKKNFNGTPAPNVMKNCELKKGYSFVGVALLLFVALLAGQLLGNDRQKVESETKRIQRVVDALRASLSIPEQVSVSIVAANKRLVSVERSKEDQHQYILSFDRSFLTQLNESELSAAIAHELGHVWIFTHHPFLQTEELANQIAMRVVPRATLEKVYEKVWKNNGKGNLQDFLGTDMVFGEQSQPDSAALSFPTQRTINDKAPSSKDAN